VSTLVFIEHHGGQLHKGSLGVLTKAISLGFDDVAALLIGGEEVQGLAAEAAGFGAATVHVAIAASLESPLPQPRVDVIADVVRNGGYDTILFSNSVLVADIAAGLSARLDAGVNWDLTDIEAVNGQLVGKRLALGDSVLVEVGWRSEQRVAVFRSGSFDAVEAPVAEPRIDNLTVDCQDHSLRATMVEHREQLDEGPSLEDAEVIVAGGMGLGGAENFVLAEQLAIALGGAVGATRAAVYAGWRPHSFQIGQTGKTVAPRLYVALGISGAIQHKVGMQRSKVVIAINKDPGAPIFEVSDLAVVGDALEIVPKLTKLVEERRRP
jgi:electron transfer flavoprotein alpha subunit